MKSVVPDLATRIDAIVTALEDPPYEDEVPVHGDFHSSQLLIRGSSLVGLIDVDTAGRGARSNDLATLLAHMSAVGLSTAARRHIDRYGRTLIDEFDQHVDPRSLRRKVAAVIRVNMSRWGTQSERRVALAERWMTSAAEI